MAQLLVGIVLIALAAVLGFYGTQLARDGWMKVFTLPLVPEDPGGPTTIVPTISSPLPGSAVGPTVLVTGISPFVLLDHYVMVTAVKTGVRYIVGDSFRPDSTGTFSASARFGSGDVGVSEEFSIQVIASNGRVTEGEIMGVPTDAKVSKSVTITRTQ